MSSHVGNLGHLTCLKIISSSSKGDIKSKKRVGEWQIHSKNSINIISYKQILSNRCFHSFH